MVYAHCKRVPTDEDRVSQELADQPTDKVDATLHNQDKCMGALQPLRSVWAYKPWPGSKIACSSTCALWQCCPYSAGDRAGAQALLCRTKAAVLGIVFCSTLTDQPLTSSSNTGKFAGCSLWQVACTKPSSATAAVPDTGTRLRTSLLCPGRALALPAERLPAAGDASGVCTTWEQTAST